MKDKSYINDINRLKEVLSFNAIGSEQEVEFDELALMASLVCETPIALISLIDDKKQWYKSKIGIEGTETKIEETICQHTILQHELLEIEDASIDYRTKYLPAVDSKNGIKFYAGHPLISNIGEVIGTVCIVDSKPKKLSKSQKQLLSIIANQAMNLLEKSKKNTSLINELSYLLKKKINEKKEQLALIEGEYNRLFNAIEKSNIVITFSPSGKILSANQNFLVASGYSEQELIGKHHKILLHDEDLDDSAQFWKSLKYGGFKSGNLKRKHKDGSVIWLQASYNPILNKNNKVLRVVKIAQNVTFEAKAKKAVEELNTQKDNFIANMSHEIRTPINAIMGFTELLLEQESEKDKIQQLNSVKIASDNLLYLVNDILDLSKIEAGLFKIDHQEFKLDSAINEVFRTLELKAKNKKIKFEFSIDEKVHLEVIGDKNRLIQILINLIGNALKFTEKGSVLLQVTSKKQKKLHQVLVFTIKDTGIGVSKEEQLYIFDRFSQANKDTSRKYGGTGLGLNISKQLVELQGGEISMKSELGKGTTFKFTLPYEKSMKIFSSPGKAKNSTYKPNKSLSILVCEDNELNQKLIGSIFRNSHHHLQIVSNGKLGIEALVNFSFDIVLMDIQMPVMDGYKATQVIRQELQLDIPIIALTAHSMILERDKCLDLGMNDYLSKPFKKEQLFELITKWTKTNEQKHVTNDLYTFNLQTLEELIGNDPIYQQEMIHLFIAQCDESIILLNDFFSKANLKEIGNLAHKLKTSFGMLSINSSILEHLEELSKNEETISVEIRSAINQLEKQVKFISNKLSKLI